VYEGNDRQFAIVPELPTALPRAGNAGCVLLFGGSFDPVHRGHVALSRAAASAWAERTGAEVVRWFVPASRSPHKAHATMFDGPTRIELLNIALRSERDAAVWDDELRRAAQLPEDVTQSFSIDTATRARRGLDSAGRAEVSLRWLMGEDQALSLHRWKDAHALIQLAPPVIMRRRGAANTPASAATADDLIERLRAAHAWSDAELHTLREGVVQIEVMDVSSSEVRTWLGDPHAYERQLDAALPPGVLQRILQR